MSLDPDRIESAIKGHYEGISARLRRLDFNWDPDSINGEGDFLYLAFRDGKPTVEEFVSYLEDRIVDFALPASEKKEAAEAYEQEGDTGPWVRAVTKAQRLFARAHKEGYTSGEPGELALFVLLEGVRSAPQIACKMHLKTAADVHVHGADSVHVMWRNTSKSVCFIWGESKLHSSLRSGIRAAVDSLDKFVSERGGGRSQIEREIDIIREHMDVSDPDLREMLIKHFDPYSELSNERTEIFACFLGFDYDVLDRLVSEGNGGQKEEEFQREYATEVERACQRFEETVVDKGLDDLRFMVFLIPFRDVRELRRKFLLRIGAAND